MFTDIFSTDKKYSIIYADPPWSYKAWDKGGNGCALNHYGTMTKQDIFNLPVEALAADDAVLFLWVTFPCLEQGLETMERWGFKYKTLAFNWVKKNKSGNGWFWGLGFWTRSNSEICLLATKGSPKRAPCLRCLRGARCSRSPRMTQVSNSATRRSRSPIA